MSGVSNSDFRYELTTNIQFEELGLGIVVVEEF